MTRKAKFAEHQMCLDWLNANPHNDFDPEVMNYPTMELYVSPDENPNACLPIHAGIVLESIGFGCQDVKHKLASSLELLRTATERARSLGMKELIYLSSDERTDEFAMKALGFRPIRAYRLVIP